MDGGDLHPPHQTTEFKGKLRLKQKFTQHSHLCQGRRDWRKIGGTQQTITMHVTINLLFHVDGLNKIQVEILEPSLQ